MTKNQIAAEVPLFKINDKVCYSDTFSFNPAYRVLSIGLIIGIHIYKGKGMFLHENSKGKVLYTISGCSELKRERELSYLK